MLLLSVFKVKFATLYLLDELNCQLEELVVLGRCTSPYLLRDLFMNAYCLFASPDPARMVDNDD